MKCLFDGDSVYLHRAATSCSCVCSCVFLCVLVCALVCVPVCALVCSCVFLSCVGLRKGKFWMIHLFVVC